jgi:hypothetical protein
MPRDGTSHESHLPFQPCNNYHDDKQAELHLFYQLCQSKLLTRHQCAFGSRLNNISSTSFTTDYMLQLQETVNKNDWECQTSHHMLLHEQHQSWVINFHLRGFATMICRLYDQCTVACNIHDESLLLLCSSRWLINRPRLNNKVNGLSKHEFGLHMVTSSSEAETGDWSLVN